MDGTFEAGYSIKIGDFGMSRAMQRGKEYYRTDDKKIPVRWCSPEVCTTHF